MEGFGQRSTVIQHGLRNLAVFHHLATVDIAVFKSVLGAANGDVGLHLLHFSHRKVSLQLHLFDGCRLDHFATDSAAVVMHECVTAHLGDSLHKFCRNFVGSVGRFDKNVFARLKGNGIVNEIFC